MLPLSFVLLNLQNTGDCMSHDQDVISTSLQNAWFKYKSYERGGGIVISSERFLVLIVH